MEWTYRDSEAVVEGSKGHVGGTSNVSRYSQSSPSIPIFLWSVIRSWSWAGSGSPSMKRLRRLNASCAYSSFCGTETEMLYVSAATGGSTGLSCWARIWLTNGWQLRYARRKSAGKRVESCSGQGTMCGDQSIQRQKTKTSMKEQKTCY